MEQIIILRRQITDPTFQDNLRKMRDMQEPHTWATFYPFRDVANKIVAEGQGFGAGEVLIRDDDGEVVLHTIIGDDKTLLSENCLDRKKFGFNPFLPPSRIE